MGQKPTAGSNPALSAYKLSLGTAGRNHGEITDTSAFRLIGILAVAVAGCRPGAVEQRPNLLLITLDTTRVDRLGPYGYERAKTPVLNQLAKEGVLFERAYSPAPLTLPVHATLMTGLYPPEHGLRTNGAGSLPDARTTLSELLTQAGYDTGAFVASFVLDGKFGLKQGFAKYDDDLTGAEPTQDAIHRNRDGKLVVDATLNWLNQPRKKPFFCWVHLYDPHAPYDPRSEDFDHAFDDAPYDGEIAYIDRQVGRLLDALKQHPDTLVVLVGDHGESLGDHFELQHGYTLYSATQHVPLIVRGASGSAPGTRVAAPVSLVDVFPTILELLGQPAQQEIRGRSFAAALHGQQIESRNCYGTTDDPFLQNGWSPLRSVTTEKYRYIRTAKPELYDLFADPKELTNLAAEQPELLTELESLLTDLESGMTVGEADDVQLSSAEQRALAGLGYTTGGKSPDAEPEANTLVDVKDMLPFNLATQNAIDLMDAGKPAEAEPILRKVVAESPPEHASSRIYLGSVYEMQGRFDEAEELYKAVLERRPEETNALFHLGGMYAEQDRLPEAIKLFERARDIEPDSAQPLYNLGLAHARLGEIDRAQQIFELALQIDPEFPGVWTALGNILSRQGRTDEAAAAYQAELDINPKSVEAHVNLGVLYGEQNRLEESRQHLEEAAALAPENSDVRFNLGISLSKTGEHESAVAQLQEAVRLRPNSPNLQTALGNSLVKLGRLQEAEAEYRTAMKISPNFVEARVNLGALLGQAKRWQEALDELSAAAKESPDNVEIRVNLALCYEQLDDVPAAIRELEMALRLNPDHARAKAELARIRGVPKQQ